MQEEIQGSKGVSLMTSSEIGRLHHLSSKEKKYVSWRLPSIGSSKFNVDGAARGKPSSVRIGVLRNCKRDALFMFSKNVGVKNSNEAKVLAILEALHLS